MFYANTCIFMNAWNSIYDIYLMQSQHILASRDWKREQASWSEHVQQLERELGAFCMGQDDEAHGPGGGDA